MGLCFGEKPFFQSFVRGAIRGFLKNRGVGKGGKVKAFGRNKTDGAKSASASEGAVKGIANGKDSKDGCF